MNEHAIFKVYPSSKAVANWALRQSRQQGRWSSANTDSIPSYSQLSRQR